MLAKTLFVRFVREGPLLLFVMLSSCFLTTTYIYYESVWRKFHLTVVVQWRSKPHRGWLHPFSQPMDFTFDHELYRWTIVAPSHKNEKAKDCVWRYCSNLQRVYWHISYSTFEEVSLSATHGIKSIRFAPLLLEINLHFSSLFFFDKGLKPYRQRHLQGIFASHPSYVAWLIRNKRTAFELAQRAQFALKMFLCWLLLLVESRNKVQRFTLRGNTWICKTLLTRIQEPLVLGSSYQQKNIQ